MEETGKKNRNEKKWQRYGGRRCGQDGALRAK